MAHWPQDPEDEKEAKARRIDEPLQEKMEENAQRESKAKQQAAKRQEVADKNVAAIRMLSELPDLQPSIGFTAKYLGCACSRALILIWRVGSVYVHVSCMRMNMSQELHSLPTGAYQQHR